MIRDLFQSVAAYFETIPAIRKYGLFKYILLSSVVSLIIGLGVIWGARFLGSNLSEYLIDFWKWDTGSGLVLKISSWLSSGIFLFVFWFIYKYIIFILLSPLLSFISEDIEGQYDGTESIPFQYSKFFKDMIRGIRIAVRNLIRELFYIAILLILGLFPVFTVFSAIGIFMVQAYFAGFGNMDYYLERRLNVSESVQFVKRRKLAAIGNGGVFLTLLAIPMVGIMVAPFFGAISATLYLLKESDV